MSLESFWVKDGSSSVSNGMSYLSDLLTNKKYNPFSNTISNILGTFLGANPNTNPNIGKKKST